MSGLTNDAFLGGQLMLRQPRNGYRAGVDPLFLAAAVPARPGETVLELGTGIGTALLALGQRVNGLHLVGVELQEAYAQLARYNATQNAIQAEIVTADLTNLPSKVKERSFDHVIANPPYHRRDAGIAAADSGRERGRGEHTPLADWIETALRRARTGGRVTLIQRAERLQEILRAATEMGSISIHPLQPRIGRPARLVVITGQKGAKGSLKLHAPTLLHSGPAHETDAPDYSPDADAVLRSGASWPWVALD
ncbi:MAG: methyltransferase [Pseudomonadota bacterium]